MGLPANRKIRGRIATKEFEDVVNGVETRLKDIKILVVTCSSKVVVVLVKYMEVVIDKLATVTST